MNFNLSEIFNKTVLDLSEQAKSLQALPLPELIQVDGFNITDKCFTISASAIREKYNIPDDGRQIIYIYSISIPLKSAADLDNLIAESDSEIVTNPEGFCQITRPKKSGIEKQKNNLEKVILYIGTSKTFAKRIQEHVGHGSKGTATICLRKWPAFNLGRVGIDLTYLDFGAEIRAESLKLIEFEISSILNPLIGHNRKA